MDSLFNGHILDKQLLETSVIQDIKNLSEACWKNTRRRPFNKAIKDSPFTMDDILDAQARMKRFAPYFEKVFPETQSTSGILESPIQAIPSMARLLEQTYNTDIPGSLYIKLDSHLPISGSIKARGGIYEVLKTAENIAAENGLLNAGDCYTVFDSPEFKSLFSKYSIAVGSTGNLGLSIGIMSAKLGFNVTVHMSADARSWKKNLLRSKNVTVIEYEQDYSTAVKNGRQQAERDPFCHFVDDENSRTLFLGYAVSALRLKAQLADAGIAVDADHPLAVYLPCGVGGGPGGVCFGLNLVFGEAVHCFLAEPTHSPCMMLGLATGLDSGICVQDLGLDNITIADGLAVGRASGFVGSVIAPFLDGCYSLSDNSMSALLAMLADSENLYLEPSALAGMLGPVLLASNPAFSGCISPHALPGTTHMVWATGGSMVPVDEMSSYYEAGKRIINSNI